MMSGVHVTCEVSPFCEPGQRVQALSSMEGSLLYWEGPGPFASNLPSSSDLFLPTSSEIMFLLPVADGGWLSCLSSSLK